MPRGECKEAKEVEKTSKSNRIVHSKADLILCRLNIFSVLALDGILAAKSCGIEIGQSSCLERWLRIEDENA